MAKISINIATGTIQQEEIIVGIDLGTTNSALPPLGSIIQKARQSLLFNAEYDYASKYFVQVSLRRDGSSLFGSFPSVIVVGDIS